MAENNRKRMLALEGIEPPFHPSMYIGDSRSTIELQWLFGYCCVELIIMDLSTSPMSTEPKVWDLLMRSRPYMNLIKLESPRYQ